MPDGAAFNVFIPLPDSTVFVHEATAGNTSGQSTYLDHSLLNGNPNARVLVTQNWNPGGGLGGVDNAHYVGLWYNDVREQWAIFNQDFGAMPNGAAFNVLVEPFVVFLPLLQRDYP
jgi:hypothetical protein